jgi:hypothetical protein
MIVIATDIPRHMDAGIASTKVVCLANINSF